MRSFLLVALLVGATGAIAGEPRLELTLPHARVATARADYWVRVRITPRDDDRLLVVEVKGAPGEYRRSDYALEGARGWRVKTVWFTSLPAGCYMFVATVYDGAGNRTAYDQAGSLHVIDANGDPCA